MSNLKGWSTSINCPHANIGGQTSSTMHSSTGLAPNDFGPQKICKYLFVWPKLWQVTCPQFETVKHYQLTMFWIACQNNNKNKKQHHYHKDDNDKKHHHHQRMTTITSTIATTRMTMTTTTKTTRTTDNSNTKGWHKHCLENYLNKTCQIYGFEVRALLVTKPTDSSISALQAEHATKFSSLDKGLPEPETGLELKSLVTPSLELALNTQNDLYARSSYWLLTVKIL